MSSRSQRLLALALFLLFFLLAIAPIRSYDLFWHLATGRWIVEHRALPASDPFAVASDREPWINGEWLFQVVLHAVQGVTGIDGLSWVRALLAALIFLIAYRASVSVSSAEVALPLTALAFAGALPIFDVRPSGIAALFVLLATALASRKPRGATILYALLTIVWINVHPSALLAPVISLLLRPRSLLPVVGVLGLLVNPHGLEGITAPLSLLRHVGSGEFVNAEWLPSAPMTFPLLYICLGIAILLFATAANRRAHVGRMLVLAVFAWLAVRHVRNQPLFFAVFPFLVAPAMRTIARAHAYAVTAAAMLFALFTGAHGIGLFPRRFPVQAVARLKASGLPGNLYNPDQFGGFLIWSLYPQRRVLTDGRNELYHAFIPEYAKARGDQRAWRELLRKYRIDLAVDEYRAPLEVIDAVTRKTTHMPASLAYWPRRQWALIAFDDAGMVFARRAAFSRGELEKWEIRGMVPDR
jgi:hypothetical protein